METAIRKTFTIYNKKEKRMIKTFNYLDDAKNYLSKIGDSEIFDTNSLLFSLMEK